MLGDRKMATAANQLAWNRLGIGYIGPLTMQEHHRETLRELLAGGQRWQELPYVAGRDEGKPVEDRTVYRGLGHTVELEDQEQATSYEVRHLYVHSSTLAQRDRQRREKEMAAIEEELQRIQRLVNKYDYTRPEMIVRRVQSKAFKKRRAQRYFDIQVVEHAQPPEAPLELRYQIKAQEMAQEAELDGVYLLVAGGPAAALADGQILPQWKGQYKVEHCFGLMNQLFLVAPIFLKTPQRIVSLVLLIMIGCLVAGLIQRQVRRAVAEHQEPIRGLMPEGRDTLKPTVTRILKAFAHYGLVQMRDAQGQVVARRWGRLNAVQQQILDRLGLPHPAEVFGHRRLA